MEEQELTKEQKAELEDLLTHPGFNLYQKLVDELVELAKLRLRDAKNWDEHVRAAAKLDVLEFDIKPLIQKELGMEE